MQRYILHAPVARWFGLYSYQWLSLSQAQIWIAQGAPPLVRHPSLASTVAELTGQYLTADPSAILRMRGGDEALIVEQRHSADTEGLPTRAEGARFGLLRMVAVLSPSVTRIVEQDYLTFTLPSQRTIQTHAWLDEPGAYAYLLLDRFSAKDWLAAGPYRSLLRHDVVRRALAQLTCSDIPLLQEGEDQRVVIHPGDQALVFHLAFPPGEDRPKPYAPDPRRYSDSYLLAHSEIGVLTRLSETFYERHYERYPYAQAVPRLRTRSAV